MKKEPKEVLTELQIMWIKRILKIMEVAETQEMRHQQKLHLMKWFDFNLQYLTRAEVDGQYFKMVYIDPVDERNYCEVTVND